MNPFLKKINELIDEYLSSNLMEITSSWSGIYHLSNLTNVPQSYLRAIRVGKVKELLGAY